MLKTMKKFIIPVLLLLMLTNTLHAQEVILKKGKYIVSATGKEYTGTFKEYDAEKRLISATGIKDGLLNDSTSIYYPSGSKKELRYTSAVRKRVSGLTGMKQEEKQPKHLLKTGRKTVPGTFGTTRGSNDMK